VRGGGGPLDGPGGFGVGAEINHPGAAGISDGTRHHRHLGLAGGRARGRGDHRAVRVARGRVDDQQQVGSVLADGPPYPLGEFRLRVPAQPAVGVVGHRGRGDAEHAGR
jgi:hypothetical protein